MEMSKAYIQTDTYKRIVRCEGGYTTPVDLTDWLLIDEGTGDKYNLCQTHYFSGGLTNPDGTHRYIYDPDLSPAYREATAEEICACRSISCHHMSNRSTSAAVGPTGTLAASISARSCSSSSAVASR